MICKKCGKEKIFHGFFRRLITRGKNKGVSEVIEFYSCACSDDKRNPLCQK